MQNLLPLVIDIAPNNFDLSPGETISISFTMVGMLGVKVNTVAVCEV